MDPQKVRFLFGEEIPDGFDPDDPAQRRWRLATGLDEDSEDGLKGVARFLISSQIAEDDPPQVWQTAQRLLEAGVDAEQAFDEMAFILTAHATEGAGAFAGNDRYLRDLAGLPMPEDLDVADTFFDEVESRQPVLLDELCRGVVERLGGEPDSPGMMAWVKRAADELIEFGDLTILPGERIVDAASLFAGAAMTHVLSGEEIQGGMIFAGSDLTGLADQEDLELDDGTPIRSAQVGGDLRWFVPNDWMDQFQPGQTLVVSVTQEAVLTIRALAHRPPVDEALVGRVRTAYEALVDPRGFPVAIDELVLEMLAADRGAFAEPRAPLSELCAAAGLECRLNLVAADPKLWENQRALQQAARAWLRFQDDKDRIRAAAKVLEIAEQEGPSTLELKSALVDLADTGVAIFVAEELTREEEDGRDLDAARSFATRLAQNAGAGRPTAVAHWFAALVEEEAGEPLAADGHLQRALASGQDWEPVLERAAWYASDKGDAATAVSLLHRMKSPLPHQLETLSKFIGSGPPVELGRNEPCWCGSGRKFKLCHLNQPARFELPERIDWLCFKAASYLQHSQEGWEEIGELAELAMEDDEDQSGFESALSDPLVMDLVLTEGGWFEEFVADRGPLLPEDEALLAESWLLVDRTVYEVVEIQSGKGITLRDLATGDRFPVRERTFSREAQVGELVCARAVPDGQTHQFIGGIFTVPPGREEEVLDLCADGDPQLIYGWLCDMRRPPAFKTREGQAMVACEAVWRVIDPAQARRTLDAQYKVDEDGWVETHALHEDESIIRARFELEGDELVVTTLSEERLDAALARLEERVPGELVSQKREPLRPRKGDSDADPTDPFAGAGPMLPPEMIEQLQQKMEERWLSEPVPALAGLTPRQAAEDPTRREMLERLLDSFDATPSPAGAFTFRTERLREELGL